MNDDKVKMTDTERHTAASKRAREQSREIDQLKSEYTPAREINEVHARHLQELEEILGELNQPLVGKECRTV